MNRNNNLSVLPFYQSIDEQDHRKAYAYGEIYPLFTQVGVLPPFQIVEPHSANSPSSAVVYKADGTAVTGNILNTLINAGFAYKPFASEGYDVYVYPGTATNTGVVPSEGQFYIAITIGATTYYSDVFTAVQQVSPYLKVEWQDREDLVMDGCRIVYDLGSGTLFKNRLYLYTELGKPDYTFEEEVEKRDGLIFPEKMISAKTFKFTFIANEPLCDVMRFIRMADIVTITDKYGRTYECDQFLMTPKWETQGNIASVSCEFQVNTVAKRIGRAYV